MERGGKAGV